MFNIFQYIIELLKIQEMFLKKKLKTPQMDAIIKRKIT